MQNLLLLSQFGLSLAAPLLLCLFFCHYLVARWQVGAWVYIPGFFFGLGGSFTTAWKLYRRGWEGGGQGEEGKGKRIESNDHR